MNRNTALLWTLAAGLGVGACGEGPTAPEPITQLPRDLSSVEAQVIDGSNAFAFDLLREVRAANPDSANTFLSPLSASMALGMAATGAGGDTWTQMRDALGFAGLDETAINEAYRDLAALLLDLDPAVEFGLGNAAWVDEVTLLPDYVDRLETYFGAEVGELDFDDPGAADVMNAWVDDVTNGRISKLLDQADPDAVLYLINAIYFKADWVSRFDEDRTRDATFSLADGGTATVDMMEGELGYRTLNAGRPDLVQAVELPYGGDAFAAVAVLPPAGQSMAEFLAALDQDTWDGWVATFEEAAEREDRDEKGLLVRLPPFELEWGGTLNEPLQALGMTDAFIPYQADFGRITDTRDDLYIFEVRQKTFVKVDEKGTEAAAATSVGVGVVSVPPNITFDRPFLFAIRERLSGTILFMGVIGDPTA
jgi:serine protease inhibitor